MNAEAEALRSEVLALPEAERSGRIIDLLDGLDERIDKEIKRRSRVLPGPG